MKINHNYFAISNKIDLIKSFYSRGHIVAHLLDRVKWHIFPRLYIVPNFPTHIDIEASSKCNLQCPMCKSTNMRDAGVKFGEHMEMKLYTKLLNECVNSSLYSIKLSWRGEPLLHPILPSMVALAKRRGIKDVAFLTNGVNLTPSKSLLLVGVLDWVSISFDGFKEDYERIRYPAKFEQVLWNVKELRRWRDRIGYKKPQIRIQSLESVIEGRKKEFLNLWKGIADKVYFIPDQVRTLNEGDYKHDLNYVCPNPWQRMVVASNGTVPQCITDYPCDVVLGDANTQTLREIWHSDAFAEQRLLQRRRKRLNSKPCRVCGTGAIMKDGKYV